MKKTFLVITIAALMGIFSACNNNDDNDLDLNEFFHITRFDIGSVGLERFYDLCHSDNDTYYAIVDVEVEKGVFERKKYSFINKYEIKSIDIVDESIEQYKKCKSGATLLRSDTIDSNKFFTDNGYIIRVNTYDAFRPNLILFEEYNNDDQLINTYKKDELDTNIEELLIDEIRQFKLLRDNIYISYYPRKLSIYDTSSSHDSFVDDGTNYFISFSVQDPFSGYTDELFKVFDNGDFILVNDDIDLNVDDIIQVDKDANESNFSLYYFHINE